MQLDLNLLVAFDALLEEGSVMGAAARLHLSTPAVSRTLGRIRNLTGDQILVRTGRTMTPTPYALAVREQVHLLVHQGRAILTPQHDLDLPALERTFTLQIHDAILSAIAAELVTSVQVAAPGVALRFLAETATDTADLRHGRVDLEIGATQPALPEIRSETVGAGRLVVALRPDHPLAGQELTIEAYARAQHVITSRRGRLHDRIDDVLAEQGLRRRVVAAVPTSTAALQIVRETDVITAVTADGCRRMLAALHLRTLPLPFAVPPVPVICAWHQRYDTDPAHSWLRAQVRRAIGQTTKP